MTRLKRVLTLLDRYDDLAAAGVASHSTNEFDKLLLWELREEKEKLTQELIEHGCRRDR